MNPPLVLPLPARPEPGRRNFNRRQFFGAVAAAGLSAALGDALVTYAPWLNYDQQARRTWDTPFQTQVPVPARMREVVRYATLAPSGHNAQPWKFSIAENTIRIFPDNARRLPVIDPQDRELWISLGCALENMVIAAQASGYEAEVTYPAPGADCIVVHLKAVSARSAVPLFEAIPHRQSTRSLYQAQAVPHAELNRLERVTPGTGVTLQILTAPSQKETVIEYVESANQQQYGNQAFVNELVTWLRFNKPEALHSLDGLYTACSGNPQIPRWLGQRFITSSSAGRQSDTDVTNVRSSSGLIVIAAAQDDKHHWTETGRLYERLALTMTALNIKTAFLNQPVEVADVRSQFQSYLHLGTVQPQLLMRFGYAPAMPCSLRRPVEQVLVSGREGAISA